MDYLFLHREPKATASQREKNHLFRMAEQEWERRFADIEPVPHKRIDEELYKWILYHLEIKMIFLDPDLSLAGFSRVLETNQTYLSIAVNRYFGCNYKELINTYRIRYARELLHAGEAKATTVYRQSGFRSKSAFYATFRKMTGMTPARYVQTAGKEQDNKE